jgi:hypothetical protein
MLEEARSIREGLWRMARYTQDAAEALDSRIEDEDLDGLAEAVEVREALERLQALSLELRERKGRAGKVAISDRHRRESRYRSDRRLRAGAEQRPAKQLRR